MLITKHSDGSEKKYTAIRQNGNRAEYISGTHDDLNKDTAIVTSQAPKRQGNSLGVRRASVNFVRSVPVPTVAGDATEKKDAKIEIVSSFPVGMADTEFDEFCVNAKEFFSNPDQLKAIFRIGKIS